ncbi:MAG: ribosome small subunit-dependent GTPase A [Phycisphaerae bacterium]|nr:ribosome small subunit-dependent GTPase A [Phycisphaerae bacterium]
MPDKKKNKGEGKKVRVPFRRNRLKPAREKDWTQRAREAEGHEVDSQARENVVAKGDLSRQRTIIVRDDEAAPRETWRRGVVLSMRGLFAAVDEGERIVSCTVRRVLRTRLIDERHPVAVGDRVFFSVGESGDVAVQEGVIEAVESRKGELRRLAGRRVQTIAANVDQAVIVSSAAQPAPKPHFVDRYIVAAHAGDITPVVCMNKMDLDEDEYGAAVLAMYAELGYRTIATSAVTGAGIDELRALLTDKESVIAGQSGVGKSSLLNAVDPELALKIGAVMESTEKGRHTTTTAELIRLSFGGYVVDTPGIRSLDLSIVPRNEYEAYFVEFAPLVPACHFPDCTHTHEERCAIKEAVERGDIRIERYESYLHLFTEPGVMRE